MLFKDQALALVARWECITRDRDIHTVAVQTAIELSKLDDVPPDILEAIDGLLDYAYEQQGKRIYEVVKYLRSLTQEKRPLATDSQPQPE